MILIMLLLGIAEMGYRGKIGEKCLSSLVAWAKEYGVEEVLKWIKDDSGLLSVPSWQFPIKWMLTEEKLIVKDRRFINALYERTWHDMKGGDKNCIVLK